MSRVRTFFVEEASECLTTIRSELADGAPDPTTLHSAVRRLRGSAQVARFGGLAREAGELERMLKPVAVERAAWGESLDRRMTEGLESLARGVAAVREGRTEQDTREAPMDEHRDPDRRSDDDVVPMETLEYRGAAALERALGLRGPLEDAIFSDDPPGPILDELFDLIRLGTK